MVIVSLLERVTMMSAVSYGFEAADATNVSDVFEMNFDDQTGGDWYATMLSASMGNKNIEGASMAGSSEVLMKVDFDFAAKKRTGKLKVLSSAKMTPKIKEGTEMVAKTAKKFRGVTKANSFSVTTEDTLWGSNATNRLKSGAYLAASMIGMGTSAEKAGVVASSILGTEIPKEVVAKVAMPLSILKRDTAVLAKSRSNVFLPSHVIQDVIWEDGQLVSSDDNSRDAIDWARITAVAKYIGGMNAVACPKFKMIAEKYHVPYALVNNHWAVVTNEPYVAAKGWADDPVPLLDKAKFLVKLDGVVEHALKSWSTTAGAIEALHANPTVESLIGAMRSIEMKKKKPTKLVAAGTDVLTTLVSHSVDPGKARLLVLGSESSYNAFRTAVMEAILADEVSIINCSKLIDATNQFVEDEGLANACVKELMDKVFTQNTFARGVDVLADLIGDLAVARDRMAKLKRSLLGNSSAFSDSFRITHLTVLCVKPMMVRIAKAVIDGNVGMMHPPSTLANPIAAMQAGETMRLLADATKYLAEAKDYWATRYQAKATKYALIDVEKSVHYGAASSAMKLLKADWLVMPDTAFLPTSILSETYLAGSVMNYARKRNVKADDLAPYPGETSVAYADRMDKTLQPDVTFASSLEFAKTKIEFLVEDFSSGINAYREKPFEPYVKGTPWEDLVSDSEDEEEVRVEEIEPAPDDGFDDLFDDFFADDDVGFKLPTMDEVKATWGDEQTAHKAALANGYANFTLAYDDIKTAAVLDELNDFTKTYMRTIAVEEEETLEAGDGEVI